MGRESVVRTVLAEAADLCERGWIQGNFADGRGVCIAGGIFAATNRQWPTERYKVYDEARLEMNRFLGVDCLSEWNDAPERTKAEVVAALRAAAEAG